MFKIIKIFHGTDVIIDGYLSPGNPWQAFELILTVKCIG